MFQQLMHRRTFCPLLLIIVCLLPLAATANNNTNGLYAISSTRIQNDRTFYDGTLNRQVYPFGNIYTMDAPQTYYVMENFSRSNYSSRITAVGAENPYTEDVTASVIRRAKPEDGMGDPGATPVGNIPWILMSIMVLLYVWRSRKKARL